MTAKQMKRKRPINADLLNKIEPITDNQKHSLKVTKRVKIFSPMVLLEQVKPSLHYILR